MQVNSKKSLGTFLKIPASYIEPLQYIEILLSGSIYSIQNKGCLTHGQI